MKHSAGGGCAPHLLCISGVIGSIASSKVARLGFKSLEICYVPYVCGRQLVCNTNEVGSTPTGHSNNFLQIIKNFVIIIIESEREKIIPCSLVVKHAAVNR